MTRSLSDCYIAHTNLQCNEVLNPPMYALVQIFTNNELYCEWQHVTVSLWYLLCGNLSFIWILFKLLNELVNYFKMTIFMPAPFRLRLFFPIFIQNALVCIYRYGFGLKCFPIWFWEYHLWQILSPYKTLVGVSCWFGLFGCGLFQ